MSFSKVFATTLTAAVPAPRYVTATATDGGVSISEFSPSLEIVEGPLFTDGFESGDTSAWSAARH